MSACYLLDASVLQRANAAAAAQHAAVVAAPPATPGPGIAPPPPEPHWPVLPDGVPPDIDDPEPPDPTAPINDPPRVQIMLPVLERWFWYAQG